MFERLKIFLAANHHRLCYVGLALIYLAACLGWDKLLVSLAAAVAYLLLAVWH